MQAAGFAFSSVPLRCLPVRTLPRSTARRHVAGLSTSIPEKLLHLKDPSSRSGNHGSPKYCELVEEGWKSNRDKGRPQIVCFITISSVCLSSQVLAEFPLTNLSEVTANTACVPVVQFPQETFCASEAMTCRCLGAWMMGPRTKRLL